MDLDLLAAKMADEFASSEACNEGMKWRLLKGLSMRLMTRTLFESIKKSQMRFQVWKLFQVIHSVNLPNTFDPRRKRDSKAQHAVEIPHPRNFFRP